MSKDRMALIVDKFHLLRVVGVYTALAAFFYFILAGEPLWSGFLNGMWIRYNNPTVQIPFPIFIVIDAIFCVLPYLFYNRKRNQDVVKRQNNTALIIPCHKAGPIIGKTLEAAKKIFDEQSIFVIDNGPTQEPTDNTQSVCQEHGVNYSYIPIGHKSSAIYAGALLARNYEYVLQIDDDICLDENMTFPIKEDTHCIAYTIGATNANGEDAFIHKFQDLEYKMAGIAKAFEAQIATATFPHGAISLWKRETLVEVLEKHPMYPISDDWFAGWVCTWLGYRIEVCDSTFTKTDVPNVYMFVNKKDTRESGYGSCSLFAQRFGRWYKFTVVQWFYLFASVIMSWKLPLHKALARKIMLLWVVVSNNLVLLRYMFFAFNFHLAPSWSGYMLIVVFASTQLSVLLVNYKQLTKEERLPISVLCLNPIYRLWDSLCFMIGMYYSVIAYIPFALTAPRKKLKGNPVINNIVNTQTTQVELV